MPNERQNSGAGVDDSYERSLDAPMEREAVAEAGVDAAQIRPGSPLPPSPQDAREAERRSEQRLASPPRGVDRRHQEVPWLNGIVSGLLGAAVIALIFLGVDVWLRQALWTPAALGSALFLGEPLPLDAEPPVVLAFGYTLLHLGAFIGVGAVAAWWMKYFDVEIHTVGLTVVLFLTLELLFIAFAGIFEARLLRGSWLGIEGLANALAALTMASFLVRSHERNTVTHRGGEVTV